MKPLYETIYIKIKIITVLFLFGLSGPLAVSAPSESSNVTITKAKVTDRSASLGSAITNNPCFFGTLELSILEHVTKDPNDTFPSPAFVFGMTYFDLCNGIIVTSNSTIGQDTPSVIKFNGISASIMATVFISEFPSTGREGFGTLNVEWKCLANFVKTNENLTIKVPPNDMFSQHTSSSTCTETDIRGTLTFTTGEVLGLTGTTFNFFAGDLRKSSIGQVIVTHQVSTP